MTTEEYLSWQAYNQEEPFPLEQIRLSIERMEGRTIWMLAQVAAVYANCHLPQGKSAFSADEFIPKWADEQPDMTEEDEMMAMNAKFDAYNARVAAMGIS